jgi:phosphate transport system substrate-binding protein
MGRRFSMRAICAGFLLFLSCTGHPKTLKIKGSDTEVNLVVELAEHFHEVDPDFYVSISGGGSGLGIASLINGQADMANSSRLMNEEEIQLIRKRGIALDTVIFAEDAIAFVVASDLAVDSLCTEDLSRIFDGTFKNWSALQAGNKKITIYGRQSNSGTHEFVRKKLGIEFSPRAREMNGNAQIIEAIKADRSGIGYVGAGYVLEVQKGKNAAFKVLKISPERGKRAYSPLDSSAVYGHRYFFQRHLYQYVLSRSAPVARAFLDFEKSREGSIIIQDAGYYPVRTHSYK